MNKNIYNVIGIGFGPSNIALAIAIEELCPRINFIFLEKSTCGLWQKELLFENALDIHSNIQNIPYRDLVTPRNPRSRYTFLNYLHENGRLFEYLNLDLIMPMRPDFSKYIEWVAEKFNDRLIRGIIVENIKFDQNKKNFVIKTAKKKFYAKNIVLGTGREPRIPSQFKNVKGNIFHFSKYNSSIEYLRRSKINRIAVIGSSQSAVEITLHLSTIFPESNIDIIMRRFAFPLKDTSPFMSEVYFPEFTQLYFQASENLKKRINQDVFRTNYGSADMDIIEELYRKIYYDKLHNKNKIKIYRLTDIYNVSQNNNKNEITMFDNYNASLVREQYDAIVLATGFVNYSSRSGDIPIPKLLSGLKDNFDLEQGAIAINRRYSIKCNNKGIGKIIMNGLSEDTHGMGDAGSLSLTSIRAVDIIEELGYFNNKSSVIV